MVRPKMKRDKPWITKLTEVLDELELNTDCAALRGVYEKIERAQSCAKEVHDELLEFHDMQVEHEALVKQVCAFTNATTLFVETVKARKGGA